MHLEIRDERPADALAITELTTAAFAGHPFSHGTEAAIVGALRAESALTLSLVAVDAGVIIGHAAFSPASLSGAPGAWYGLGPISVRPDRQRTGIGTALIEAGLARLRGLGAAGVVLVGDPAFYGRLGFHGHEGLDCPGVSPENTMALSLDGTPALGSMGFHPAFFTAG